MCVWELFNAFYDYWNMYFTLKKERPLNCSRTIDSLIIIIILPPNFDEVSSLNRKTCRFHVHTLYRCHEYLSGTHPVSRNILSVRSNISETKKPCYRSNTVTVIGRKKQRVKFVQDHTPVLRYIWIEKRFDLFVRGIIPVLDFWKDKISFYYIT